MIKVWSWRQAVLESDLEATTKLVLCVVSTFMNDHGGGCYPSQDTISKLCSLSERAVIKHLGISQSKGWLKAKKRAISGSKWAANEYEASSPGGVNLIHPIEQDGVNHVHVRGEPNSSHGVNHVHTNSPLLNSPLNSPIKKTSKKGFIYPEKFLEFYQIYPVKKGKDAACKAFLSAQQRGEAESIIQAAKNYSEYLSRNPPEHIRFIPHPATWLNEGRWADELEEKLTAKSSIEQWMEKKQLEIEKNNENAATA